MEFDRYFFRKPFGARFPTSANGFWPSLPFWETRQRGQLEPSRLAHRDSCFPARIRMDTDLLSANVRVDICGRCKRRRLRLLVVDRKRSGFVSGFVAKLVF